MAPSMPPPSRAGSPPAEDFDEVNDPFAVAASGDVAHPLCL